MTTQKQAAARRANGKLSRGPVTQLGKSIASQNAVKHGLYARNPLLESESENEFEEFRGRLFASFRPQNGAEIMLVDRLADAGWRLRRFPAVESALYAAEILEEQADRARRQARALVHQRIQLQASDASQPEACGELLREEAELREQLNAPQYALGRAFKRNSRAGGGFTQLSRCEMLLDRAFYRCLHELQTMQRERKKPLERQNEPTASAGPCIGEG